MYKSESANIEITRERNQQDREIKTERENKTET